MPFFAPWHMWWIFPIIAMGLMLAFIMLVIRPAMTAMCSPPSHSGSEPVRQAPPAAPRDVLRDRYARGEISREQYLEAIADILKDMYVRGEITLEEFERRLERLTGD